MQTLGGSMITYNLERFDFPYMEAIQSLCDVCDQVVVLDCASSDGTLERLEEMQKYNPHLELKRDGNWDVCNDHKRLAVLSNLAKSHLDTDWHFGLQADEVLHEDSYVTVRRAIEKPGAVCFAARRLNLWGHMDTCFRFDYPSKPCSDVVNRLAETRYPFYGDAESVSVPHHNVEHVNDIVIFHYSYVREPVAALDKAIWMTGWFWGTGEPDPKLVAQKEAYGAFRGLKIHPESALMPLSKGHPAYMKEWVEARRPMLEAAR